MYPNQSNGGANASPLTKSFDGCALVSAGTVTFFGTPPLYSASVQHVINFSLRHYGRWNGLEDVNSISWWFFVAVALFVSGRLFFSAVFMMLASRFFSRFL